MLWLWVFTGATATLFVVGQRSIEMVRQVPGATFDGWLMSDGFWAYRELDQRLRCLAHLIHKAQALEDGLDPAAQRFGSGILTVLATVMAAVYDARGAPPAPYARDTRRCSTPCWRSVCNGLMRRMRKHVHWPASC